jgi:hypothetical protein
MLVTERWVELETIMLSEISQFYKNRCQIFSHLWKLGENKIKPKEEVRKAKREVEVKEKEGRHKKD